MCGKCITTIETFLSALIPKSSPTFFWIQLEKLIQKSPNLFLSDLFNDLV